MYDYYNDEVQKKNFKGKLVISVIAIILVIASIFTTNIYLEVIQLNEIGNLSSIFMTNLAYKVAFSVACFLFIFIIISLTNTFVKKNVRHYLDSNNLEQKKVPNYLIATVIAFFGALAFQDFFYQKALNFLNSTPFNKVDPIFGYDIGYYVFQRPFLMSLYDFVSSLWLFVIAYTIVYYLFTLLSALSRNLTWQDMKINSFIRHNIINIAVFFIIKTFSYKFQKEDVLYSNVFNVSGAGYVDVNIWLNYFKYVPYLLVLIVALSFIFVWQSKLKKAAYTIAVFPAAWVLVTIVALFMQSFIVKPNEINLEGKYLSFNMKQTRAAYGLDKIKEVKFTDVQKLTPEVVNRNKESINNMRVMAYEATLQSDTQLQSNTNFYSFQDGDIINYRINGKEIPVFITAREIDKSKLQTTQRSEINTKYRYTHGYGVVINPINKLTPDGQVDFILSGLRMDSVDKNLKITEPRIYYGELTDDYVVVNANNLNEIDYDGNSETRYNGKGGINLNLTNRLLFSFKFGDFNMMISNLINSDSKLLLNRDIITRAQKAVPFLKVDRDPYIVLTEDGRLKWVLDAYTTTSFYPYSQNIQTEQYGNFNYIRNSVKIIIDAYDGSVKYYIIDKNDPIIKTYSKIYKGIFSEEPLPDNIAKHMRYPEFMFKVQSTMLGRYHLNPDNPNNVSAFYGNQDLWEIAQVPRDIEKEEGETDEIDPYYNMIRLPGGIGQKEELIQMVPYTPSKKNNMSSWLAARNSYSNYGEMILYTFPKNTNIYGPYQVETSINSIDQVSKDKSLWNQSGSRVFKGDLLVIPIENSVLYVEPIYIRSGNSAMPQVRKVVVGYQDGEEFKYGLGTNLQEALKQLFEGMTKPDGEQQNNDIEQTEPQTTNTNPDKQKVIADIMSKYNEMKKQIDEMGNLINQLNK